MKGILELFAKKEAFKSCQIEGIYPKDWTFIDFLKHELKQRQKKIQTDKRAKSDRLEVVDCVEFFKLND